MKLYAWHDRDQDDFVSLLPLFSHFISFRFSPNANYTTCLSKRSETKKKNIFKCYRCVYRVYTRTRSNATSPFLCAPEKFTHINLYIVRFACRFGKRSSVLNAVCWLPSPPPSHNNIKNVFFIQRINTKRNLYEHVAAVNINNVAHFSYFRCC